MKATFQRSQHVFTTALFAVALLVTPTYALANTTSSGLPNTSAPNPTTTPTTTPSQPPNTTTSAPTTTTNAPSGATGATTTTGGDFGLSDLKNENFGVAQEPVEDYVSGIVGWITGSLGIIFIILVIIGGVSIATSAGNEGRVSFGRKVIAWGVIGLLLVFLSYIIARFLIGALNDGADSLGTDPTSPYYGDPYLAPDDDWCNPPAGFICDRNVGGAIPAPGPNTGFATGTPGGTGSILPSTGTTPSSGVSFGNFRSLTTSGKLSLEEYPASHPLRVQFNRLREQNPNATIVFDSDPGDAGTVSERIDPTYGCTAEEGLLCVR